MMKTLKYKNFLSCFRSTALTSRYFTSMGIDTKPEAKKDDRYLSFWGLFQKFFNFEDVGKDDIVETICRSTKDEKLRDYIDGLKESEFNGFVEKYMFSLFVEDEIFPEKYDFDPNSTFGVIAQTFEEILGETKETYDTDIDKDLVYDVGFLFCKFFKNAIENTEAKLENFSIYDSALNVLPAYAIRLFLVGNKKQSTEIFELCLKIVNELEEDLIRMSEKEVNKLGIKNKMGKLTKSEVEKYLLEMKTVICSRYCFQKTLDTSRSRKKEEYKSEMVMKESKKIIEKILTEDNFVSYDSTFFTTYGLTLLEELKTDDLFDLLEIFWEKGDFKKDDAKMRFFTMYLISCLDHVYVN